MDLHLLGEASRHSHGFMLDSGRPHALRDQMRSQNCRDTTTLVPLLGHPTLNHRGTKLTLVLGGT